MNVIMEANPIIMKMMGIGIAVIMATMTITIMMDIMDTIKTITTIMIIMEEGTMVGAIMVEADTINRSYTEIKPNFL